MFDRVSVRQQRKAHDGTQRERKTSRQNWGIFMHSSRTDLQKELAKLDVDMPQLNQKYPDPGEFIQEFASHADKILDSAGAGDYEWASAEVDRILTRHGHPPAKDELPPDE